MRVIVKSTPENFAKECSDLKNNTFRVLDGKDTIEVINSETGEKFERILRDITIWEGNLIFTWEPNNTADVRDDVGKAVSHEREENGQTTPQSSPCFSKKKSWSNGFVSQRNSLAGDLMKKEQISWPDALKKASKLLKEKPKKKSWIQRMSEKSSSRTSFDNDYMARVNSEAKSEDSKKYCVLCREPVSSEDDLDLCGKCNVALNKHSKVRA